MQSSNTIGDLNFFDEEKSYSGLTFFPFSSFSLLLSSQTIAQARVQITLLVCLFYSLNTLYANNRSV